MPPRRVYINSRKMASAGPGTGRRRRGNAAVTVEDAQPFHAGFIPRRAADPCAPREAACTLDAETREEGSRWIEELLCAFERVLFHGLPRRRERNRWRCMVSALTCPLSR